MKYQDILKRNRELGALLKSERYEISLLSNITVSHFKEIIELALRENSINAQVEIGDYDALVQSSRQLADSRAVILFWEACNLVAGLQSRIDLMSPQDLEALADRVENEIAMVLRNVATVPLVLVNRFSSVLFELTPLAAGPLARLCRRLNSALEAEARPNQVLVDLDAVIADVGIREAADFRQFHSSMALYSLAFCKAYAGAIAPAFLAATGHARKIVVLDCDNTIWSGILGEDGEAGIEMSDLTAKGKVFREVQAILLGMQKNGVLLALCSKNNPADVDQILAAHPDMVLREENLVSKKVNWKDKVTNLREMAMELNLGLDSFIFVDDSEFELGLIRKELPQVACIHVPLNLSEYPGLMRKLRHQMFALSRSDEDDRKTEMYQQENQRKQISARFESIDDYLASLDLQLDISWDGAIPAARVAQLSQKTNQFNLTTRRYTETDIHRMLSDPAYIMAAFAASDRYGEYGVTGLAIVRQDDACGDNAEIDTFLMSCRVIARNIEFAFFEELVRVLKDRGIRKLRGEYLATTKNSLVQYFYDDLGFELQECSDMGKRYLADLGRIMPKGIDYIRMKSKGD